MEFCSDDYSPNNKDEVEEHLANAVDQTNLKALQSFEGIISYIKE